MCKSKAENGGITKRCFAHKKNTAHSIAYIHAKTGIDKAEIYAIMKELNKEGKRLDPPTKEELEKYFNMEEFKTKYDDTLNEKDKLVILKKLLEARAEADREGVTGGAWHAMKNAFARVADKIKRPFVAIAMAGTLLVTASCSAGVNPGPTQPEETKSPTAAECVIENPDELGDVVANEIVTDDNGTYCSVTVSPDAKEGYMALADSPNAKILQDAGFTEEDAIKAQDSAYKIVVEQTIDGTRLDTYKDSITEWYNKTGKNFVADEAQHFYEGALKEDGSNNLGLIVTDSFVAPLARDNGTRVSGVDLKTTGLDLIEFEGTNYIRVNVGYSALYRSSDANIISTIQKNFPDKTVEAIKAENPDLADENPESNYILASDQKLTFGKTDLSKVVGSDMTYSLFTSSSPNVIETK